MKRLILSFSAAALALACVVVHAGETHWDALRVYKLADGRGVAVAYPGEWWEVSRTRVLGPGESAQFLDPKGRRIEIPADALARAADAKSVARPLEYRRVALRTH
jgi:hypothetical protein